MTDEYVKLGASLYIPSHRHDLTAIANGEKYPALRSMIFCTEDAIRADELDQAVKNLQRSLTEFKASTRLRFVRVRNPDILRKLLLSPGIEQLTGFVLPKITADNIYSYLSELNNTRFKLMLTLETREVFESAEMLRLRRILLQERQRHHVLALRIGGNDLLNLIGIRRPRDRTIYETPVGKAISDLVTLFRPDGFNLTGPVFEYLNQPELLREEIKCDMAHGLFGKTAIHPDQVSLIESFYQVCSTEVEMAESLLDIQAPSVFKMHDAMCEVATHAAWAKTIKTRAQIYGTKRAEMNSAINPTMN